MTAAYLDASAFVKLVVDEPGSEALTTFLDGTGSVTSSALTRAEAVRAVRHKGPDALHLVREHLRAIDLVAIDDEILDAAGLLDPSILRTLDAIHVATALSMGDDLDVLVTYDERMLRAAEVTGIPTASPDETRRVTPRK
ncbi:MAG: type II toxin-antitoxin system VapC family toxin [Actinomycetota bacterium]